MGFHLVVGRGLWLAIHLLLPLPLTATRCHC